MKHSSLPSQPKLFSHLYIERGILEHPQTQMIRVKFSDSQVIVIEHYKEVFNRSAQSFAAQSSAKKLILARKEGKFLHEGSQYSDGFGIKQFFYASSVMGCLYDCDYCYLQGLYPSANTVLFVNLEDAFEQLTPYLGEDTLVATSYDTDTMAIESLTHQTKSWLDFAAQNEKLHLEIRTKSANIKALKNNIPNDRVTLAWTLSPQEIIDRYEHATPSLQKRLSAVREAIQLGWKVRLCIDPVIYTENFDSLYPQLIETIFATIDPESIEHLTLGSFRMSQSHLRSLKKLRRSDVAFFPYTVKDEMATYPETVESYILETLLAKATQYLPQERIRTWQRQS
ncbi:DNA repair photolyase-like protein [Sulfuricurvum kujiense DSM 16994]|uniref:DNA repair photolyase-like protein n=1 Tax=Sulfuricurvum kujiense (strain ATCC BAA-921 / DSM 16994 / JCM 11577 / YK-1) TaxID=709032 RepID=E4TXB6_SULKY|nr:DNA repair photolyase-like protein [Sulfuricurvum kujiense]ADR32813.1 DNA repair photolyase-like protein [Sulfuricurvum kujiense DSM 16994]